MSTFITVLYRDLSSRAPLPPSSSTSPPGTPNLTTSSVDVLRDYFVRLEPPLHRQDAEDSAVELESFEQEGAFKPSANGEEEALHNAILAKILVGLYVQTLETFLTEASDAETELEWWSDIERSQWRSAYYLLQSEFTFRTDASNAPGTSHGISVADNASALPSRIVNVVNAIVQTLRSRNIPLRPSVFTPTSIRQLFPSRNVFRPHILTVALFPHLHHEPYPTPILASSCISRRPNSIHSHATQIQAICTRVYNSFYTLVTLPLALARHECRFKRQKLQDIRDKRACTLGRLVQIRKDLVSALTKADVKDQTAGFQSFVNGFAAALDISSDGEEYTSPTQFSLLLTRSHFPAHDKSHYENIVQLGLRRPSKMTLIWPKLVFVPPMILLVARSLYQSRNSLHQTAIDAVETAKGFWDDWLLGPLKDVVKTVRTGPGEGVIITKESVKADLESLERMTLSLAREKLNYTPEQMAALSQQIRLGDLTTVMQIYEDDIRNPLKSAVGGTLLRTLLVQVQKAKVDIDQALSGIDKLLKSQELTFAFVGVAPALAVVYGVLGYMSRLWRGSRGRGRYGGRKYRARAWAVMRRLERLLIEPSENSPHGTAWIDPQTSGLLLLSTTHLRSYAERRLPANSRLHDGFLEDVACLEDSTLGRTEKLRVVDRMWSSWGNVLGWHDIASEH